MTYEKDPSNLKISLILAHSVQWVEGKVQEMINDNADMD